ncbi:unnamed protein product [Pocillopora meandrina]|uniref:G-protein coupled receptor n=1 Tax=Pocillopora meandrina TaxID=46732 RepID=A0AAU9XWG2_9CNID|nr:unnamed protein product [Pocillopora meandrina]
MQVKSGARDADSPYICEFHKGNSKLQLVIKVQGIPETLRLVTSSLSPLPAAPSAPLMSTWTQSALSPQVSSSSSPKKSPLEFSSPSHSPSLTSSPSSTPSSSFLLSKSPCASLSPSLSPSPLPSPSPPTSTSPLPSPSTSTSRTIQKLEAIGVFEDFFTGIKNITKPAIIEEAEIRRKSIFKVAVNFERYALSYSKHHLTRMRSLEVIKSRKMVSLVVGIVYTDLHEVLLTNQPIRDKTGKERHLDSRIIAVAMDPKPEALQENVILKFRNLRADEGEKKCVFWSGFSESSDGYSERGCHVVKSKKHLPDTVCSCNHLTHFAVLVDYNGSPKLTEKDTTILEIITYVGLSLSTTGILLTIIAYYFLTDVDQPLSQIRLNLSVAIGAGQIIFLAGINSTRDTTACVAVAALTQYFLMAAFCWMLIEAIYLYLLVVKVYNITEKMHMFHVISWGLPIIMVGISLSIAAGKEEIQSYTSDKYCWLSSADNLIWIFIAFVAFIEGLNISILVRVIKEMTTLVQPIEEANHIQQIRLGVRTCLVMFPLLGVTWLFGLFLPLHKAFAYIFTIFNSTQGFLIFALHCLRNSQIRERLKKKMNTIFPATVDHGKKTSKIDPNDAGDMWAVELQSFNE